MKKKDLPVNVKVFYNCHIETLFQADLYGLWP